MGFCWRQEKAQPVALPQAVVGGADARWLVDADLFGNGEVQREVQKGIRLPALR